MMSGPLRFLLLAVLTLASGLGDAHGFVHASRMWQDGRIVWGEFAQSALGFWIGIGSYWLAVRDLARAGLITPEVQTLLWFGVTIVGVAVVNGRFAGWRPLDQVVAAFVLAGLGFLLVRTA